MITDYGHIYLHPNFTWQDITKVFVDDKIIEQSELDKLNWHEYDIDKNEYYNDNRYMTLDELSQQIYERQGGTIITVLIESPLRGIIYQIGNYSEMTWYKKGETIGYA